MSPRWFEILAGVPPADWAGLAAAGWLVAALAALVAARQYGRVAGVGVRAAEAAHELRGPLCAARLALSALERATPPVPMAAERVAAVDLELQRAARAVDDLASLTEPARTTGNGIVDLDVLMRTAAPAWRELAAARGKALELRLAPGAPPVAGDPVRLAQILGNLVANACEHGTGTVIVAVAERSRRLRVSVSDDGPGPSARRLRSAGRRSWQSAITGAASRPRGHGIEIVARLVRESGGRLSVGAAFGHPAVVLDLPVRSVTSGRGQDPQRQPPGRRPFAGAPRHLGAP